MPSTTSQARYWLLTIQQMRTTHRFSTLNWLTSRDNRNEVTPQATNTGNYLQSSRRRSVEELLNNFLERHVMLSRQEAAQRMNMSGRRTPESPTHNSNLELFQLIEASVKIGMPLKKQLVAEGWILSRAMCMLEITTRSRELAWTIVNQLQSNEKLSCIGVQLAQANQDVHGQRLPWKLT